MSYLVLARKYRSKQFSDIVGQQSIVRTLVNAIRLKRTHQAYVFSGSRGIGKTSIARIFSKVLRCPNVIEKDGILVSCDECSDCKEIAAGNSVNVLEIDGASNNGVDSVREIRENAKFLPTSGQYKIYIIDEVHMLSTAAFNALLKTLEEPPEHVVFIFATTESHKIPETILGRCQRFDFKRVTVAQVVNHLQEILKQENIPCEEAALHIIARAAEGSMRDALSILDQVISFSGMKVTAGAVRESIGLMGTELVLECLTRVLERDAKSALSIVQNAFDQGVDLKVLLKTMIEMLHALILLQVGVEKPQTHFSSDEMQSIFGLKGLRPLEENELIFQVLHHGLDLLSRAPQPKLIFDLLIVKTSLAETLVSVDDDSRGAARRSETEVKAHAPAPIANAPQPAPAAIAAPAPAVQAPAAVSEPAVAPQPAPPTIKTWDGLIDQAFRQRPMFAVIFESVIEWTLPRPNLPVLKLGFREKDRMKIDQLSQKQMRDQLSALLEGYFEYKVIPEFFISGNSGESVAERSIRLKQESKNQKIKSILSNEIVLEARSLFGAELSQIEIAEHDA